jgi:multidrug efflux pump subunit AcrB
MKHISELVFKKKKIFYFLLVAIIIGGSFSFLKLSKLEDPEITVMIANVVTVYPGASAHDVELKVTNVLEDELSALSDINNLKSRSEANVSIISVELTMEVPQEEIPQRWEFLRRKLELAMPKLPKGVQTPMVIDDIGDVYGLFYAMVADEGFSYTEMDNYADFVERSMLEVDGVRKVSVYGSQKPEIFVSLSAEKMSELGVLPMQIYSALQDHTKELYAGNVHSGDQMLRVSIDDKSKSVEDLKQIMISNLSGEHFLLGDIAKITKGYSEPNRNTFFVNNEKALGIGISMEQGENIVDLGKRVDERMEELRSQIPNGIRFEKVFFQAEKVENSINDFMWNLILSVVIVIVVLMFTMGFKGGVIIGSGLALTILATFPILLGLDGTLQRISLGAFIVAMGMLVDNAIVVLDGILNAQSKGKNGKHIFTKSAKQTAIPLLGATLIAITAFFPVYLSPDTAGTYVRDLFIVLAISLSISWILALTQVPLFTAIFYKKRKPKQANGEDLYNKPLYKGFKYILLGGMKHRLITLGVVVVLVLVSALGFEKVDKTFFPDFNYDQCYIEHTLPKGSSPDLVNANLAKITSYLNEFEEVELVVTSHGMTPMRYCLVRGMMTENADNYGELIVNFKDYKTMLKMRPIINDYLRSEFPEAISRVRKYNLSIKASHTIEAEFTGPDPAVLKDLSKRAQAIMLGNPNVDHYTVCDDWAPKAKTLTPIFDPVASNKSGTTRNDISNAILAATDGLPITTIHEGETAYPVKVRIRDNQGQRIENLNDIPVWNTIPHPGNSLEIESIIGLYTGATNKEELINEAIKPVPLSAVTKSIKMSWEEPVVRRLNGKRSIQAQCDAVDGYSAAAVQKELTEQMESIPLPEGYTFEWVGESELKRDGLKNILSFIPVAAGIILLILLLLFNDYKRPIIILLCLPVSIVGIVTGLIISGQPFSFIAIVGVIGLSGMIIKNAIVLLDEIKLQLKYHNSAYQAVITATMLRVRPVIMASLTTILGMLPLLTDPMYASMSVAIISGLIVGTLVTLVFVPILYSLFFNVKVER